MKPKISRLISAIAICISASLLTTGQVNIGRGPDLGSPGEEHQLLNVFTGSWDVSVKFPLGNGKEAEGAASCTVVWVFDGRFLKMEYNSTFFGKSLTILRYVGFDRYRKRFTEIQFESTHTDVLHTEGVLSADSSSFTCYGSHIEAMTGKEVNVRSVTQFPGKNSFIIQLFYGEGAETKPITLIHQKKQ